MLKNFTTTRFLPPILLSLCLAEISWGMDTPDDTDDSNNALSRIYSAFSSLSTYFYQGSNPSNLPDTAINYFTESKIKNIIEDISERASSIFETIPSLPEYNTIKNDNIYEVLLRWRSNNMDFVQTILSKYRVNRYEDSTCTYTWIPRFPQNLTHQDLKNFQTLTDRFKATDNHSWAVGSPIILIGRAVDSEVFKYQCWKAIHSAFIEIFNKYQ